MGNDFAQLPYLCNFTNDALCGHPIRFSTKRRVLPGSIRMPARCDVYQSDAGWQLHGANNWPDADVCRFCPSTNSCLTTPWRGPAELRP
jgi:hypothetical protein